MRKNLLLLSGIAILLSSALFSCTFEELGGSNTYPTPPETVIRSEVRISSNIVKKTTTLVHEAGRAWKTGDSIGVFMFEKDNLSIVDGKTNVKYAAVNSGYNSTFNAINETVYFPDNEDDVRFMSYYPYSVSIWNYICKLDVRNQIPQSDIDFLYSFDTLTTYNKTFGGNRVPISFDHQMSKIYINVKPGAGLQGYDIAHMTVAISGLPAKADFNLLTEEISNYTGVSTITPSVIIAGKGNSYSGEAIVLPTSGISGAKITFLMSDGKVYSWPLDKELKKGTIYTFDVTISGTGITATTKTNHWNGFKMS